MYVGFEGHILLLLTDTASRTVGCWLMQSATNYGNAEINAESARFDTIEHDAILGNTE